MIDGARRGERALDGLGNKAGRLGQTFDQLNTRTNLVARAFGLLVAIGITQFFNQAVQAAGSFETAMAEVSTLVDETTFNLGRLETAILAQSRAFAATPVQQAQAAYQIISAGAGNAQAAIELLDASNRLAVGGVTDVATAADGLTSVLNAYGMAASQATDVSDILFVGMRAGKTTIGELAGSLGNVAPLAAQAGVGFDELVASIAALTKGGISTQQAVTGVRAILAAVVRPTQEAADAADRLGLDFNAAALESQGFAGFMDSVVTATGGSSEAMAQLFGGVEALVPALALAGQAGVDMTQILEDMEERGGATQEAFERITNTFEFQAGRLRSSLLVALTQVGTVITDLLTPALRFLADNFDMITRFVTVAAIGLTALMIPAIFSLIPAIATATTGLLAMAAAWILTPFGAIQALIIGAAAALAYFGDTNVEVGGRVATVWQVFKAVLLTAMDYIAKLYDVWVTAWQGIFEALSNFATGAYSIFLQVWNWATAAWTGAKASASGFFSSVADWLDGFLGNWGLSLDTIGGWIRTGINTWIGLHVGFIAAVGPTISEGIPALFQLAMARAKNIAIAGLQNIINVFVRGLGGIGGALDMIPGIEGVGDAIRDSLTVDFGDLMADTAALETQLSSAGANITSAFGGALERDYIGELGTSAREGAATIRNEFDEHILNPFSDALVRSGQTLANDFGANLDAVIESQGTSGQLQEILNSEIEAGTPAMEDFGGAAGGAAGAVQELTASQREMQAVLDELRGPQLEFEERQRALSELLANDAITMDEYNLKLREAQLAMIDFNLSVGEGTFADGFISELGRMVTAAGSSVGAIGTSFGSLFTSLTKGFADSIGKAIVYGKDLKESLIEVARQGLSKLISSLVEVGIQMVTNQILGRTLGAAASAATAAQAGAAAAAWATPAALASLATVGANAAAASAGIASTVALTQGLAAAGLGFANGTPYVQGPGSSTSDSVLAALSVGEGVVTAAANRANPGVVSAMNAGATLGGQNINASVSSNPITVVVENHAGADIKVEQISETEIRIIAREESENVLNEKGPDLVANQIQDPNSVVSDALVENTTAERAR